MALISEAKAILADLIEFPTVSCESNLELIAYAADRLDASGASVSVMPDKSGQKANLFATIGPEIDGGIVLSGHTDVVPADEGEWTSDPFLMREADGLLYGRGACDMKGFIAAALAVAQFYAQGELRRPVHYAFTHDEEVGCIGAKRLIDEIRRMRVMPAVAIIGEPTEMRIVDGHKGCFEYTTSFAGLAGHGSQPAHGVNAVEYAARFVTRLMQLAEELKTKAPPDCPFDPPWTTLQIGRISGGIARNVIPDHCAVEWEMRPVRNSDAEHVKTALTAYCDDVLLRAMRTTCPGAAIVTETIGEVAGLEPVHENEARRIVFALTGASEAEVVAFGTEAGLFQSLGMSAVVCGPGSIAQAHKRDEFVDVGQLQACLYMLTGLRQKLEA